MKRDDWGGERSNETAMRVLVWLALACGRRAGRILLVPVTAYFVLFSVRSRAASKKFLGRVLGRAPRLVDVYRHYYCFATVALDRMFLLRDRTEKFDVHVSGMEILEEITARGQSCFLIGAHLGSFEVLRALGRENRAKVNLVMFEAASRGVNAIARTINPGLEADVIAVGEADSMLKLSERLARGEWVGMLGDRALGTGPRVSVPFLGEPALLPVAPYRIAAMLGCPVILMLGLYRGGNRYDLCFERLIDAPRLDRATREQTLREWAGLYAQRLEHHCRSAPYNWFNFYDFWADAEAAD